MSPDERFNRSVTAVLAHEGGFVNNPHDPGGATNLGVTQNVYDAWRSMQGLLRRSVKEITRDEAMDLYRLLYWNSVAGDKLPPGVDYMAFDTAVNMGVRRAAVYLQTALSVRADGKIGPMTLEAAQAAKPRTTVTIMSSQRQAFYRASDNFPTFGKGWLRRLAEVTQQAEEWAL